MLFASKKGLLMALIELKFSKANLTFSTGN